MQIIENNQFKAEIDEHGAQLTHLFNKPESFDYIWNDEFGQNMLQYFFQQLVVRKKMHISTMVKNIRCLNMVS